MCTSGCQSARGRHGWKSNHLTSTPPTSLNSLDSHKAGLKPGGFSNFLTVFFSPGRAGFCQCNAGVGWLVSGCPADRICSRSHSLGCALGRGTSRVPWQPVTRPLPTLAGLGQAVGPLLPIGMPYNPAPSPPATTSGSCSTFAISSWSNTAHGGIPNHSQGHREHQGHSTHPLYLHLGLLQHLDGVFC